MSRDVTTIATSKGSVSVTDPRPSSIEVRTPGPAGPKGDPGVHVGPTPPSDTTLIWVDTSGA